MQMLSDDVTAEQGNRILIVPESISHNAERRLCQFCSDTVSRFAEVLSFTRLADRVASAAGCGTCECMDNGGRVVVMAAAAVQLHSKLKSYAAVETRPEFLISMVDALDEFKRSCIRAEDLQAACKKTEGSLAQKLEELALLIDTYDGICRQGKRDPSDQLTWLLEQMEDCTFAQEHTFYFDGFTDFTGQQMAIVRHLVEMAPEVVISLNCDEIGSSHPAFEKAGETAAQLMRFAKTAGIPCKLYSVPHEDGCQVKIAQSLFHGKLWKDQQICDHLCVAQCDSLSDECDFVADQIMSLVRKGKRFRDIRVVCTDLNAYRSAVNLAFSRRGIPVYLSGTEDILDMPIINTVLTALDAASGGFEQQTVIRYLRSALSPVNMDTCDQLENYAVLWNIHGDRWRKPWINHPDGLADTIDDSAKQRLDALNVAKDTALGPLLRLSSALGGATLIKQQVEGLYGFLEDIEMASRLDQLADMVSKDGNVADAQVLSQLWEILLCALEQMYGVLGHATWNSEAFVRLLKLLLSQYDVGTIPPVLDAVTVGGIPSSRFQREDYLFVLGALEGLLPSYGSTGGVLTEQERLTLRQLGVCLSGGALDSLRSEFADIYNVFAGAESGVWVSCPAGQPSFIYRRLASLAGQETEPEITYGAALSSRQEAGALLVRCGLEDQATELGLGDDYARFANSASYALGSVSYENISRLYGKKLNLSASQVDKLADCRMAYFLKYGLRAKERKEAAVDPAEFGTYVHAVLEQTAKQVKEMGGFHCVTLEQTLEIANRYSEAYALQRFSQLDSQRVSYLLRRNAQELTVIVTELWEELRDSRFEPVNFELAFGDNADLPAIVLPGKLMSAQLRGFVDRVDLWNDGACNYFRVVDYKTGKKDFDYCDVFNGLGLQMLLYMFALEDGGTGILGSDPVPAGVQYFPARSPLVSADGAMTPQEAKLERIKLWKRKGLILNDDAVLNAMESSDSPIRMSYSRKKDGTVSGDVADRQQLRLLKTYVFALLGNMVDDIASGCVDANPYTRGNSHNACAFCPYGAVCHPAQVAGRRDYKAMTAQYFWEQVEKEVGDNG